MHNKPTLVVNFRTGLGEARPSSDPRRCWICEDGPGKNRLDPAQKQP